MSDPLSIRLKKPHHRERRITCDDARHLIPLNSDVFQTLINAFYVVGNYPWSTDRDPKILYSFPRDDPLSASYVSFLLPRGSSYSTQRFSSRIDLFQSLYDPTATTAGRFNALYFPETSSSPYLFTYRFQASPLTLPTFAHAHALPDLLAHMSVSECPATEVCIAIRTKFPFYDLFSTFIQWLLESETVGRMAVCDVVERHLNGESALPLDAPWPAAARARMADEICAFASLPPPDAHESIVIDLPPLRVFRWQRPHVPRNYYPLARRVLADVVRHTDLRAFSHLFSALLLERTIVIFHPDDTVVSNAILALHFMLRPLRWASGSVSLLPERFEDLLNAPNPLLVGRTRELVEMPPWFVYFDLVRQGVKVVGDEFQLLPEYGAMERALKRVWHGREGDLTEILAATSKAVGRLLEPIAAAIVSNVSENGRIYSQFFRESYLRQFPRKEREFVETFAATQMFQLQVEQDCRRRSDRLSSEN